MIAMRSRQHGAVLFISLIILLVLTILAISGMQGSVMQERMAGAQSEGISALEAAEDGARVGELWVKDNVLTFSDFDSTGGLYDLRDETKRAPSPYDETTWTSEKVKSGNPIGGVTPVYFVEYQGLGFAEDQLADGVIGGYNHESGAANIHAFRVVARAEGPSGRARRIIEVYFTKQI
ncbi:pilus assembly PilX family protein [Marinobacter changyiensis]|uniref:pilus assembly PilX family protein n=1 Tax=Marinobacter changyiensis TaxID=2604091 RepID=UPI001265147D|nr:PilX N-terminal domain-containing pilus assembly protein [Marinobacter changyiensis]